MPPRNRIIMTKRRTPKRVTLPDGRTFLARYKRATRGDLPHNVNLIRPYRQRAAPKGKRRRRRRLVPYRERAALARRDLRLRNQSGRGFGSALKKAINFGKKALNSKLGKKAARMVISKLPDALETVGGKVKNKRLKKILTSDLAKTGTDYATSLALDKLQ